MRELPSLPLVLALKGKGLPGDGTPELDQPAPQLVPCVPNSSADTAKLGLLLIFQVTFECHLIEKK